MISSSFFNFFEFKNEETAKAIAQIISQNEGILPEKIDRYLHLLEAKKKGKLMLEMKYLLKKFRGEYKLCLSDLMGLTQLAMNDIDTEARKLGEKYASMVKKK